MAMMNGQTANMLNLPVGLQGMQYNNVEISIKHCRGLSGQFFLSLKGMVHINRHFTCKYAGL